MNFDKFFDDEWRNIWFNTMTNVKYLDYVMEKNKHIELPTDVPTDGSLYKFEVGINSNVTTDMVLNNPTYFDFGENCGLGYNENMTTKFIDEHPEKNWCWEHLSHNKNITMEYFLNNQDKEWCFIGLSNNPNLTQEILDMFPNKEWFDKALWDNIGLAESKKKNAMVRWHAGNKDNAKINLQFLSSKYATMEMILNDERLQEWCYLDKNPNLTFDIVLNNLDKPWNWWGLSYHPNLTFDIVLNNLDKYWNWWELSRHPCITMKIINEHIELKWHWDGVLRNPNLTIDMATFIKTTHKYGCDLDGCDNLITLDEILNSNIPWNWEHIIWRNFTASRLRYVSQQIKWLHLTKMHEYYNLPEVCKEIEYSNTERVFFDNYLIKQICLY